MNPASAVALAACCALFALGGLGMAQAGGYFERHPASADTIAARGAPSTGAGLGRPLWPVPQFAFTDQRGRPATEQTLLGHVWIADFIFTDGSHVVVDSAYVRRSLVEPSAQMVAGYLKLMPSYADASPAELDGLVSYVLSLRSEQERSHGREIARVLRNGTRFANLQRRRRRRRARCARDRSRVQDAGQSRWCRAAQRIQR